MQWMKCWYYIVYPIDVSLDFNDTGTELDGWCVPKSAVRGIMAFTPWNCWRKGEEWAAKFEEQGRDCKINPPSPLTGRARTMTRALLSAIQHLFVVDADLCLNEDFMKCAHHDVSAEPMEDACFQWSMDTRVLFSHCSPLGQICWQMVSLFFLRVCFRVQLIKLRLVIFIQQAVFISGFSGWPISPGQIP